MQMSNSFISNFIDILNCPICRGEILLWEKYLLKCSSCDKKYKIHKENIPKLFTPENIYPTKNKIKWKNINE